MSKKLANNLFEDKTNVYVTECLSTNDFLIQLSSKNPLQEGSMVITDFQTKGKGQRNNFWNSNRKENLLFSFILYPEIKISEQFILHIITSLSVYYMFKKIGLSNVKIKWPNDIYINNKKVCGILIENQIFKKRIKRSILGIGININQKEFGNIKATSIYNEINKKINRKEVLGIFKSYFSKEYNQIGSLNKELYKEKLFGYNETLNYKSIDNSFKGKIVDVRDDGRISLIINEKIKHFEFGSLELLL
jgi:BirA family biotin operon repressor/biotin-[acetyl-CoA-carboxylase] ligase